MSHLSTHNCLHAILIRLSSGPLQSSNNLNIGIQKLWKSNEEAKVLILPWLVSKSLVIYCGVECVNPSQSFLAFTSTTVTGFRRFTFLLLHGFMSFNYPGLGSTCSRDLAIYSTINIQPLDFPTHFKPLNC